MIHDLLQRPFGVESQPHDSGRLLQTLGFSSQQARFVSAHLAEATQLE